MTRPVRILLVEDNDLDAAHFTLELRRGGLDPQIVRVETRQGMLEALDGHELDLVVCDYTLPQFSAPEALALLKTTGKDLPFIVISGAVGEETAVELMREGAADYLLKHRLTRLTAAIERELAQANERRAKRRAEDLFRAVLRAAPHPSAVVDRFSKGIVDGSDTFRREFMRPTTWTLFDAVDFTHPERVEALIARGSGTAWNAVYRKDGVTRVANIRCYSVDYEGSSYAYLVLDDVTEQNYLKAAFDAVPDPLLILSTQQTLLYANRPAEQLFGDLYFGASVTPILPPGTLDAGRRVEIRGQLYVTGNLPFRFAGETESSMILTLRNVSEETELLRLATHDALTGVYNTRYFDDVLRKQPEGCLAVVDLDYFKPINDELGHAAGDAALILFTNLIRAELRPNDVFARLGGDEFAIYFPRLPLDEATSCLDAIYRRLARSPFRYDGATRTFSASAGITVAREGDTPLVLRKRADESLYEAKRQGRGRWLVSKGEG